MPIDVTALDVDFLAFSGPQADGADGDRCALWKTGTFRGDAAVSDRREMIDRVTREGAVFAELPHKFEAGTVNAGRGAAALAAAIDYLESIGWKRNHGARGRCLPPSCLPE